MTFENILRQKRKYLVFASMFSSIFNKLTFIFSSWMKASQSYVMANCPYMNVEIINRVENVAKRKNAHLEQSLFLPQCFQKVPAAEASESICLFERVDYL